MRDDQSSCHSVAPVRLKKNNCSPWIADLPLNQRFRIGQLKREHHALSVSFTHTIQDACVERYTYLQVMWKMACNNKLRLRVLPQGMFKNMYHKRHQAMRGCVS